MQLVYYAHSYREEDARVTGFFLELLNRHGLTLSLDPPSNQLNSAKLERHLRSSDGLVAVLTERTVDSFSKYILYEVMLAVRARKPTLIFVEDDLPGDVVPHWMTQRRFSRRFFGRQVRELRSAVTEFRAYLGSDPPARYGAHTTPRSCVITGFDGVERTDVERVMTERGYEAIPVEASDHPLWHEPRSFTLLNDVDLAICDLDASGDGASYLAGLLHAAFVPTINASRNPAAAPWVPEEFFPCDPASDAPLHDVLSAQVDVFEQDFLEVGDAGEADRYVAGLIAADAHRSEVGSFRSPEVFFMGDQVNIDRSQVGAIGDNAVVAHNTFEQLWTEVQDDIDLRSLADELEQLRASLGGAAATAEETAALGEAAQAEIAARNGDGPTVMQRLRSAGRWLLAKAEEVGTPLVSAALRQALGL
ncbi:MAG: hypothetical protein ACRD0R_21375 [Acidimicrobiales bacterium]